VCNINKVDYANPPLLSQKQRYRLIIALNRSILPITLTGTTVNRLLQSGIIFLYLRKTIEYYSCISHYHFWSPSSPWSLSTDYKQEEEQSQPYTHENPDWLFWVNLRTFSPDSIWLAPATKTIENSKFQSERLFKIKHVSDLKERAFVEYNRTRENLKRILIRTEMVVKGWFVYLCMTSISTFCFDSIKKRFVFSSHMIGWKLTW
jgi:hypothetical protein